MKNPLARLELVPAPGCGKSTHVIGTNEGTVACGAMLTMFGRTAPYFCTPCFEQVAGDEVPTGVIA